LGWLGLSLGAAAVCIVGANPSWTDDVQFKKVVLDTRFVSEGAAVGDVNKDGKLDIMAGNAWYEAPDWTPHEIAPVKEYDPKLAWSNSFNNWAADLNGDGWVDQIVIGRPGSAAVWRENPKGEAGPWKVHTIWRSACNESPLYVDLLGTGQKVLVMGYDTTRMAWLEPAEDPYAEWICHDVSELNGAGSGRYWHGLGAGDITGDGRNEIITKDGYYTPPADPCSELWTFVNADLGDDCAHMFVLDSDEGGVLSTSAHNRGVWWFRQTAAGFKKTTIDDQISVTHAAEMVRLGDSINLITGKRKWGHPPGVDPGSEEAHLVVRYEFQDGKWVRHIIDEDSGVGTQFEVSDVNGDDRLDIVTSNKNGVFLFVQTSD
jgi:hypothetical protein